MKRRFALQAACAAIAASGLMSLPALAADTIKVGILHSLSGTMAISRDVLKDVALMTIDEINAKGGVLGKKLEPVVVDPASNWPLFAEKAKQLIDAGQGRRRSSAAGPGVAQVGAAGVRGAERPAVLPGAVRGRRARRKNVFYTGAAPNQQAIPAVEYLMSKDGGGAKRCVLLGTDYVYPRTTNKILRSFLHSQGRRRRGHHGEVHAVRPQRLPDHRRRHQEVRGRRQDGGGLDHQRRLERAVLQGARQPGPEGRRRAGRRVLGRRRRAARRRHQAAGRPPGRLELLHVDQEPDQRGVHQEVEGLRQGKNICRAGQARHQRPDGSHLHRHPHVGAGGREGQVDRHRQGDRGDGRPDLQGAVAASPRRWTRRTTTCTSRCSSARSRPTASSTWCGRRRARSRPSRGARSSREQRQEGRARRSK